MSVLFSAVDDADDPGRAISYLDVIADAATGMKHYAAAAHAQRRPQGLVLDLGCGSGHDPRAVGQTRRLRGRGRSECSAARVRSRAGGLRPPRSRRR